MRWFNRWVARRVEAAMNDRKESRADLISSVSVSDNSRELNTPGIVFYLYPAVGGTVIEIKQYDRKNDRHDNRLYIIPDGTDFHETLTQIVTMERIKS